MNEKLRVLLDTNMYASFLERRSEAWAVKLVESNRIILYGFDIIRKELRATPLSARIQNMSLRTALLEVYDQFVAGHKLYTDQKVIDLTRQYLNEYNGGISKRKLWNDFLIVACASTHGLDILVSEDKHSMFSALAINAFREINQKNGLRTPKFHLISDFEKEL